MWGRIPEMLQARICEQSFVWRWDLRTAPGGREHLTPPPGRAALGACAVLRLLVRHVCNWELQHGARDVGEQRVNINVPTSLLISLPRCFVLQVPGSQPETSSSGLRLSSVASEPVT